MAKQKGDEIVVTDNKSGSGGGGEPGTTLPPAIGEIATVTTASSLTSTGQQPSMLVNQSFANAVQNRNYAAQNAVSNQQAHNNLTAATVGKTVNLLQDLQPLQARSAVEVLTGNELAAEISALKAALQAFSGSGQPLGPSGPAINTTQLVALIRRLVSDLKEVLAANAALTGDGTSTSPYSSENPIYVEAPATIAFPSVTPAQLQLEVTSAGAVSAS